VEALGTVLLTQYQYIQFAFFINNKFIQYDIKQYLQEERTGAPTEEKQKKNQKKPQWTKNRRIIRTPGLGKLPFYTKAPNYPVYGFLVSALCL